MTLRLRALLLGSLAFMFVSATALMFAARVSYRVDFESLREIWADLARDADKIGLTLTRISTQEEMEIGDRIAAAVATAPPSPTSLYVAAVGARLAEHARRRNMRYRFDILERDDINSFAIPGGRVYVTTGMLRTLRSESELACVLGHEIAHIDLRHPIERMQYEVHLRKIVGDLAAAFGWAYWLFDAAYSQQQEIEADRAGMLLAAQAGYSPLGSLGAIARISRDSSTVAATRPGEPVTEAVTAVGKLARDYFRTHPDWATRAEQLKILLGENAGAWASQTFCVGRSNYRRQNPCFTAPDSKGVIHVGLDAPEMHLALGLLARTAGRSVEAAAEIEAALKLDPQLPQSLLRRGREELAQGSTDEALEAFDAALLLATRAAKEDPVGLAALRSSFVETVELSRSLGRPLPPSPEALDYSQFETADLCRLALDRSGTDWDSSETLRSAVSEARSRGFQVAACVDFRKRSPVSAKEDVDLLALNKKIAERPVDFDNYKKRGLARRKKGDLDGAIADYDRAIELMPDDAEAYLLRGSAWLRKGDFDRALADDNRAILLNPADPEAYNCRCWTRATLAHLVTDLDNALADCNESLRLRPANSNTLDSRGLVYLRLSRYDEAIADYDARLLSEPDAAGSLFGRGVAKLRKGDAAGATKDIAAAKSLQADIVEEYARYGVIPEAIKIE